MRRLFLPLVVAALLGPTSASADVISGPPPSCPEGSSGRACHGPLTCEITDCSTAGCPAGQVCANRDLCVRTHCCNGRGCGSMPLNVEHVTGPCTGGACTEFGTTCESRRVCVPGTNMDAGGRDGGATGVDAGGRDGGGEDGGGVSDGGDPSTDSGTADTDSGPGGGTDSGPAGGSDSGAGGGMDAGPGGATDGGCCAVYGRGSPAGGLVAALVLALAFWRSRRRRAR